MQFVRRHFLCMEGHNQRWSPTITKCFLKIHHLGYMAPVWPIYTLYILGWIQLSTIAVFFFWFCHQPATVALKLEPNSCHMVTVWVYCTHALPALNQQPLILWSSMTNVCLPLNGRICPEYLWLIFLLRPRVSWQQLFSLLLAKVWPVWQRVLLWFPSLVARAEVVVGWTSLWERRVLRTLVQSKIRIVYRATVLTVNGCSS